MARAPPALRRRHSRSLTVVQTCLRLGFAGTPQFAVAILDALTRSRHAVVAVYTKPDRPAGRGRPMHLSPVKQRAEALGIPVYQPPSLRSAEAEAALRNLRLDALVVVAYGLILPAGVLSAPKLGCINIHASLLPRWRGAAPIHRALLAGDPVTGISIMRMETGLDTGPTLAVRTIDIGLRETAGTLHDRLAVLGADLIVETLDAVAEGTSEETPQPSAGVLYAEKIGKAEATINWSEDADRVLRQIRAFNPWPVAETLLEGTQLRIWEAELASNGTDAKAAPADLPGTVVAASGDGIEVACGRGMLRVLRLQLAGRRPVSSREFLKARQLIGTRFTHASQSSHE